MPQQESRVKKSLLNARVNLIFYFLTLVLSFFSRKIFLDTLGADFVGLTGTLQNLLGFLNLAELGIGSAIGYVLYKPLFDHDETKINEIISVFGYLYRWIGFIILGAGLVLACFLPLIFPNTQFEMGIIFFAYFAFLASSLIGYFANYKQTLLGADQKNYVVTAYFQTATIIKTLIQMASAYYTGSYYLWVAIELSFGIIYSFILNWKINQVYPWLRSEVRLGKQLFKKYPEVMKYTKQLFVHQIGTFVQYQLTPFLVYAFTSLTVVACYTNYTLIIDKLSIFIRNFLGSTRAGVGNLVAEGNKTKIKTVFYELLTCRIFVSGIVCILPFFLMDSFISLWIGDEYVLDKAILVVMLLNTLMVYLGDATEQFIYGYGLFWDVWSPIARIILLISISIVGGTFWGLPGVLLGSMISQAIVTCVWKTFLLFHWGFKEPIGPYILSVIRGLCIILFPVIPFLYFDIENIFILNTFFRWFIFAIALLCSYVAAIYVLFLIFVPSMRSLTIRVIRNIYKR